VAVIWGGVTTSMGNALSPPPTVAQVFRRVNGLYLACEGWNTPFGWAADRAARMAVDTAPAEIIATLLDEKKYLCSTRTMYRVLAASGDNRNEP
jgi:hypothetical protein